MQRSQFIVEKKTENHKCRNPAQFLVANACSVLKKEERRKSENRNPTQFLVANAREGAGVLRPSLMRDIRPSSGAARERGRGTVVQWGNKQICMIFFGNT